MAYIHRALFDRILSTMATKNNITIITMDSKIPLYDVKTLLQNAMDR